MSGQEPLYFIMVIASSRGFGCIRLQSSKGVTLVDPYTKKETGQTLSGEEATLVLASHSEALEAAAEVKGKPFIIHEPGEFEVGGVFVYALSVNGTLVFLVEIEGVRMLHLGTFAGAELPESVMNTLEGIDVLFVPVGGGAGKDPKTAHALAEEIEPKVVVPIWYGKGVTREVVAKEFGAKNGEVTEKFKIEKKDLPEDEMSVVFLS